MRLIFSLYVGPKLLTALAVCFFLNSSLAQNNVTLRLIGSANANYAGAGGTYGTGGNLRYDLAAVYGSSIPATNPPAAAPALGTVTVASGQIQFSRSGTTGSNYIVQVATNLLARIGFPWSPRSRHLPSAIRI